MSKWTLLAQVNWLDQNKCLFGFDYNHGQSQILILSTYFVGFTITTLLSITYFDRIIMLASYK